MSYTLLSFQLSVPEREKLNYSQFIWFLNDCLKNIFTNYQVMETTTNEIKK